MATISNYQNKTYLHDVNYDKLTLKDCELLDYALSCYSFVNGYNYHINFLLWIVNIKKVYQLNERLQQIINVLNKCNDDN